MYCPKCGKENPDNAQLCCSCSWLLTSISSIGPAPDAGTSKLAVTALVLAILSFFTLFITAIPALIFGIISLVKIEKSRGQLKGRGLAITGIVIPFTLVPVLLGILMPALAQVKAMAQRAACGANMSGLGRAMLIYASDNDEMYPTTSKWCDLLIEHTDVVEKQFRCHGTSEGRCNYAMNKTVEKLGSAAPPDMVLLFETYPGWNQAGGPEILTTDNHNGKGCNVVFIDMHAQFVRTEDINDLRWTPEQ